MGVRVSAFRTEHDPRPAWAARSALVCTLACGAGLGGCGGESLQKVGTASLADVTGTAQVEDEPKLVQLASAGWASCGTSDDGRVWCWGKLPRGASSVPVLVEDVEDVVAVDLAFGAYCARHRAGKVSCWGWGGPAGLAVGERRQGLFEVDVEGATQVVVASTMACALREGGRVACWGDFARNDFSVVNYEEPRDVMLPGAASRIAAGDFFACALVGGGLWCWRPSEQKPRQLGGGTYVDLAVTMEDGVCAVTSDGALDCFGAACGRSRLENKVCHHGVVRGATAVAAGRMPCVRVDGTWRCWGYNATGGIDPSKAPTDIWAPHPVPVADDVVAFAPGWTHSCALHEDGGASCWGSDFWGELGRGDHGTLNHRFVLGHRAPNPHGFSLGNHHACVVAEPAPRCWGTATRDDAPFSAAPPAGKQVPAAAAITRIVSGVFDACGSRAGAVVCVGSTNLDGLMVLELPEVEAITVGEGFGCAIAGAERKLWCWGWHYGIAPPADAPASLARGDVAVLDPGPVTAVAAGRRHLCWAREGGKLFCRGSRLHDFDGVVRDEPVEPLALGTVPGLQSLAAADGITCVLADGEVSCWGRNQDGELGNGTWTDPGGLARVKLPPARAVAVSSEHGCAVTEDGAVWCWGENQGGQLGTGDRLASHSPRRVLGVERAIDVVASEGATCAIRADGEVWCWGERAEQLLSKKYRDRIAPSRVVPLGASAPPPKVERIQLPSE